VADWRDGLLANEKTYAAIQPNAFNAPAALRLILSLGQMSIKH